MSNTSTKFSKEKFAISVDEVIPYHTKQEMQLKNTEWKLVYNIGN